MSKPYFNLAPRYTAGSPAAVWDRALAERIAREEQRSYERYLEGVYGTENQEMAQKAGVAGIVEERVTFAHHFIATDMITGEKRDSRNREHRPIYAKRRA
jgi:hypothetical protein